MTDLDKLVAEFRQEFEAGEKPDPGKFLAQAEGDERIALAAKLDEYLDNAPPREWDPGAYERSPTRAAVDRYFETVEGTTGTWPELLPELRNRARIPRSDLVRRLAEALGFPGEAQRVHAYYHQMEHGQLDASRVSDTVLEKLAGIVGTTRDRLRAAGEGISEQLTVEVEMRAQFARKALADPEYQAEAPAAPAGHAADAGAASPSEQRRDELDELDRLFLG